MTIINTDRTVPDMIKMYAHCMACIEDIPEGYSPADWADVRVGFTEGRRAIQVRCKRHDMNVVLAELA